MDSKVISAEIVEKSLEKISKKKPWRKVQVMPRKIHEETNGETPGSSLGVSK